jgi:hypothetical protein
MTIGVPTRYGMFGLSHSYCLGMRVCHHNPINNEGGRGAGRGPLTFEKKKKIKVKKKL